MNLITQKNISLISVQIDYWAMLLHMGIGLLAAIIIVIDALVHFFIDHRDHKWVHYVDPSLALIIVGK